MRNTICLAVHVAVPPIIAVFARPHAGDGQ